jgi:3-oxoacyl-[acyl-carrier protein] reductase
LARDGAAVIGSARDEQALQALVAEIESGGGHAAAIALDLRLPDSPSRLADFAFETFGRIDIVVNNAGATKRGDFLKLSDDDWNDGFALKFFGAMRLTRACWLQLRKNSGSVVFISGIGGRTPGAEFAIGGAVNAAILSLTKALAELGIRDGVQVNTINPGAIRTGRFASRVQAYGSEEKFVEESGITRVGEPEDVADLVAYIAGPSGRFLQGSLIDLDGGQTKTI